MTDDRNKQLFLSLIYSLQMQAMMQLGKLANPMTSKIERELEGAQVSIDMLDMLKAKSKGNLGEDETRFIEQVIADLKLNYVEERDKDSKPQVEEKDSDQEDAKSEEVKPEKKAEDINEEK